MSDDYGKRILTLEKDTQYYKEQFEKYCTDHKEEHKAMSSKLDALCIDQISFDKKLDIIIERITSKDADTGTRRLMIGTILAAAFAGFSPIITALLGMVKP